MATPSKSNPVSDFSRGFFSPFRAERFIRQHPGLLKYILIPFLINVGVFSLVIYFGLRSFDMIAASYIPHGDAWYWVLLTYLFWLLAALLTLVLVFFSFTVIGCLLASPFNDILSERTEEILAGGKNDAPFSLRDFLGNTTRTIIEEAKKMALFIVAMGLLLLFHLIPGIGPVIYIVLALLLTVFFLTVEYTGYVFGRKNISFARQRAFIFQHKFLCAGFGSGLLCLLAVPFLQLFCIPLGVVGATMLCHETGENAGEVETGGQNAAERISNTP